MPTIKKFVIESFKGIENIELDICEKSTSPVLTLIGLNESGKTTVLEAISHFVSGDKSVASLFDGPYASNSGLKLIPMHRKAAFTGKIKVKALVELDQKDTSQLSELIKKNLGELDMQKLSKPFFISKEFTFEDSALKKTMNIWDFNISVKSNRGKSYKDYVRPAAGTDQPDFWLICVNHIQSRIEQVSYFPTFLVDMPAKIYLEEHEGETAINRHYRFVFQDILDSLGEELDLEKHVCQRIRDFKEVEENPNWLSKLFGSPSKGPIDSVFQKISSAITKEVLGSWRRIFQRSISASSIGVEWNIDTEKGDIPYARFSVSDGESKYAVNERSLGFRWFFSFLLFTAFKKSNDRKTIFIFDEPAANLHAKAQAELLTSFTKIASNGNRIIYSTHSHHMINPQWLGSAYIIENGALDYDREDNFGLDTKPTKISATPYRQFVSKFPTRHSYFQPVIEKLEYIPPALVGNGPYLIVEGISDYYALELVRKILNKKINFSIMPGVGSGASGPLISQFMGQAQKFFILLDDDSEGRKSAKRYKEGWYLSDTSVLTLADIDMNFEGFALEKILSKDDMEMISAAHQIKTKPSKKQIGWYLAESCAETLETKEYLTPQTIRNIEKILNHIDGLV